MSSADPFQRALQKIFFTLIKLLFECNIFLKSKEKQCINLSQQAFKIIIHVVKIGYSEVLGTS